MHFAKKLWMLLPESLTSGVVPVHNCRVRKPRVEALTDK